MLWRAESPEGDGSNERDARLAHVLMLLGGCKPLA
jgi:hypothetical protein